MKLLSIAVCSAVTLSLLSASATAQNAWGNYHWARKSNPFTLQVIDSVTSSWQPSLETALQEWSYSAAIDMKVTSADDSLTTRQNCPIAAGKIRVCNYTYGTNGWLGLTSIGVDASGHVDRARSRLNDSYSGSWALPTERNHTTCHELGHTLGLDHSSEDGSSQGTCMDYSTSVNSQWPAAIDYETLVKIYGHVDTYNSYSVIASTTTTTTTTPTTTTPTVTAPTTTTTSPTTTTGSAGKCTKGAKRTSCQTAGFIINPEPPMGLKIGQTKKEQIWVARREDGGIWVHHVHLKQ
ncbi:MAG: hypothetical protein V4628_15195 [Pseudomonadota bacterium]